MPRLSYVCRVCPPEVVCARAAPALEAVLRAVAVVCGWTDFEFGEARAQLGWLSKLGGFGIVPLEILAPASYLASWLAVPEVLGWVAESSEPALFWASSSLPQAARLRSLFVCLRDRAPSAFPSSLAGLDRASMPLALRTRRLPGWQALFVGWLSVQARDNVCSSLQPAKAAALNVRLAESGGEWLTTHVPYGF